MTTAVRIENADTGDHFRVRVEVWSGTPETPGTLQRVLDAPFPTSMVQDYIHDSQFFIVREFVK